jgi:hypothetical protein
VSDLCDRRLRELIGPLSQHLGFALTRDQLDNLVPIEPAAMKGALIKTSRELVARRVLASRRRFFPQRRRRDRVEPELTQRGLIGVAAATGRLRSP